MTVHSKTIARTRYIERIRPACVARCASEVKKNFKLVKLNV